MNLLFKASILLLSVANALGGLGGGNTISACDPVLQPGCDYTENCLACVLYGYEWCGDYVSLSKYTKCAETVTSRLCKVETIKGNS